MEEQIKTIFSNKSELSTISEDYYRNYWTVGDYIGETTIWKNKEILKAFFPDGIYNKKVLEIGVGGEGGIILPLKLTNEVMGVDVSDSAIDNCRKFGLEIKKLNLDKERLPFTNEYFDIVFAFEVFEHFSNPQFAIEELKRVLKDEGTIIISIPTTYTYHWPRLFYPSLYQPENFKEFLMINEFNVNVSNFNIFANLHRDKKIKPELKFWSWFFEGKKTEKNDWESLEKLGLYFWKLKDENNLRTRPVEAIDLLRKSFNINNNYKTKLSLATALLYRLCLNDAVEFNALWFEIFTDINTNNNLNADYIYRVLLLDVELRHLAKGTLGDELIKSLTGKLKTLREGDSYLAQLEKEKIELGICL